MAEEIRRRNLNRANVSTVQQMIMTLNYASRASSSRVQHMITKQKYANRASFSRVQHMKQIEKGGHSIFKVPHSLKKLEPDAFVPHIVSIGPYYHRHKDHLMEMETYKWILLEHVLKRAGMTLETLKEKMSMFEEATRKHYDQLFENIKDFVEMMLLDACFILELFCVDAHGWKKYRHTSDPSGRLNMKGFMPFIRRDLLMLENQLPLFVLQEMFTLLDWKKRTPNESIHSLAIKFFDQLMPGISINLPEHLKNRSPPPPPPLLAAAENRCPPPAEENRPPTVAEEDRPPPPPTAEEENRLPPPPAAAAAAENRSPPHPENRPPPPHPENRPPPLAAEEENRPPPPPAAEEENRLPPPPAAAGEAENRPPAAAEENRTPATAAAEENRPPPPPAAEEKNRLLPPPTTAAENRPPTPPPPHPENRPPPPAEENIPPPAAAEEENRPPPPPATEVENRLPRPPAAEPKNRPPPPPENRPPPRPPPSPHPENRPPPPHHENRPPPHSENRPSPSPSPRRPPPPPPPPCLHLLDIVHQSLKPSPSAKPNKHDLETTKHWICTHGNCLISSPISLPCFSMTICVQDSERERVSSSSSSDPPDIVMHSVTSLRSTGIGFKEIKNWEKFTDIQFDHKNRMLLIPRLHINGSTKSILLNLMVFEQGYPLCSRYITSYTSFMDGLVNSPKDAQHLVEKRIISHELGNEDNVATLFNNLRREIYFKLVPDDYYLYDVSQKLNEHYQQKWRSWIATLKHEHFKDPWKTTALFAATLLILLAITQATYTVLSHSFSRFPTHS